MFFVEETFAAEYRGFWQELESCGCTEIRGNIARLRIVEPLVAVFETRGIERGTWDMTHDELRQFVEAGVSRELFLLKRDGDVLRAQNERPRPARRRKSGVPSIRSEAALDELCAGLRVETSPAIYAQRRSPWGAEEWTVNHSVRVRQ